MIKIVKWNVATYIRLSKEDGDNLESNSITNQKDIIKQFVDNCPDMNIIFSLNEMNIFIPSEYKKRDKLNENLEHKKWNNDRVTEILKNRVYIGEITQGKKKSESYRSHKLVNVDKENWIITKNHHEPLVNEEDFNKVQELLKRQGTKVDENGNADLFYGYLICNECGSALRKSQKYYYCNTYSRKSCQVQGFSARN